MYVGGQLIITEQKDINKRDTKKKHERGCALMIYMKCYT